MLCLRCVLQSIVTKVSEGGGGTEDGDDDDDELEEKLTSTEGLVDPERLKAFNVSLQGHVRRHHISYFQFPALCHYIFALRSSLICVDVCTAVCGRESGSNDANLQTAKRQGQRHLGSVRSAVSGVSRALTEAHSNVFEVV